MGVDLVELEGSVTVANDMELLWELLQSIAFKTLAHFGHGHMYYICRCKSMCNPSADRFGSSSTLMQRTADLLGR